MEMNSEQKLAFDLVMAGKNVVITGSAGTGKSFLLKKIITHFQNLAEENHTPGSALTSRETNPIVTSLTGISSIPLKGQTLHSWAGIGLGDAPVEQLVGRIRAYRKIHHWTTAQVLIIDEISMMDLELFEKLHLIGCKLRGNPLDLFGGIQLVMSGDFLQLPPIGIDKGRYFCFQSPIWKEYIKYTVVLTQIFRQSDLQFTAMLNRFRLGQVCPDDIQLLNTRLVAKIPPMTVKPTKLYPFKKDVNAINIKELGKLITRGANLLQYLPEYEYRAINNDKLPTNPNHRYEILNERRAMQQSINLHNGQNSIWREISRQPWNTLKEYCIGAQVMLNYNVEVAIGLVNGARGVIIDFDANNNPIVLFDKGEGREEQHVITRVNYEHKFSYYMILINQYPLNLAWASTIHKAQSATLTKVVTDLNCCFSPGQTYVCLSRVRSLDGLYLLAVDYNKIWAHPQALTYYGGLGYECQVQAVEKCQQNPFVPTSGYPGQNSQHPGVCSDCLDAFLFRLLRPKYGLPMEMIRMITKYLKKTSERKLRKILV